ncbi:MAG TPA: sulfotransferase domain-containing protein [Marmoricola sp.]|nr:sulfotransferase domain-containing protein [Marmoricola sp.]
MRADTHDSGTAGRLPNLVVAGVSKAGTTSLFNYLGQHPDICVSDVKELRYFTPLRYGDPLPPVETYADHFRGCTGQEYAAEATPGYFYGGQALASGLAGTCPGCRVVVSLRSPAERCWSWFGFVKSRLRIPKEMSFEEYLDLCEELHATGLDGLLSNQPFWGLKGGCYADWMDAWTGTFGDRLRVIFFDDLVREPRQVVTAMCDWLGLDTTAVQAFTFDVDNKTTLYRSAGLQHVAVLANRHSERFFRRHMRLKRLLRAGYYVANRAPSQVGMSASARARLNAFYEPYNERLARQLAEVGLHLPSSW